MGRRAASLWRLHRRTLHHLWPLRRNDLDKRCSARQWYHTLWNLLQRLLPLLRMLWQNYPRQQRQLAKWLSFFKTVRQRLVTTNFEVLKNTAVRRAVTSKQSKSSNRYYYFKVISSVTKFDSFNMSSLFIYFLETF